MRVILLEGYIHIFALDLLSLSYSQSLRLAITFAAHTKSMLPVYQLLITLV